MRKFIISWKVCFIFFLLALCTTTIFSQDLPFTVTDIKGVVLLNKTDTLKIGERISENSDIIFTNKHSALELLNSKTKEFHYISPLSASDKNEEYSTSIKDYFITLHNAMTRGDDEIKTLKKFVEHYSNPMFLIFDENKIMVDIPSLVLDSINFLFVNYKYQGKEINIKLKTEYGYLTINEDIFIVKDKLIIPESIVKIGYYNSVKKESVILVHNFEPKFLNHCECLKDIINRTELLLSLSNSNASEISELLYLYMVSNFGFIDKVNLNRWIINKYSK